MRVLHLIASPFWSGPAESIAELALAQRQLGCEVSIAVDTHRRDAPAEEDIHPQLERRGLLSPSGLVLSVKSWPLAWWRDARRLARLNVDIVHAHFSHDAWLASLAKPAGAAVVRSIHSRRALQGWLPKAAAFTVYAADARSHLPRKVPSIVLPPLVSAAFQPPTDRSAQRQDLGIVGKPVIGMVSTFQPSRRHALGLAAFAQLSARHPDARFVLVGDGALAATLRRQVDATGLSSHVTFAGYQTGERFVRWLQALDEVWILGLGNDFAARAAVQARACGVRVIGVHEGALPDWADVTLDSPNVDLLVRASNDKTRRALDLPCTDTVAREIIALYQKAKGLPADEEPGA
ncbi:MAG: glycosyltransferase [Myxococcaceae bacterium]